MKMQTRAELEAVQVRVVGDEECARELPIWLRGGFIVLVGEQSLNSLL